MQVGACIHLMLLALLDVLQPGPPRTSAPVGASVLGTRGFAWVLATLAMALSVASAAVASFRAVRPGRFRTSAAILLGLGAGGLSLVQRVIVTGLSAWLVVAGARVRRIRRGPEPSPGILGRIQ